MTDLSDVATPAVPAVRWPEYGELLVRAGKLGPRELERALSAQHEMGGALDGVLVSLGLVSEADAARLRTIGVRQVDVLGNLKFDARPDAAATVARLQSMGVQTWLLSGDRQPAAWRVARAVGTTRTVPAASSACRAGVAMASISGTTMSGFTCSISAVSCAGSLMVMVWAWWANCWPGALS